MPIESGSRLGPYEILSPIGAGGMGEVYRARDRRLERDVAVKILPQNYSAGSRQLQRFEREARLLAAISHPNICAIYDVGTDRGISFIVMEHLLGETLAARIQRGPISIDVALRYAIQIVDGLRIAHNAGLIHRDIKPGNIMITTTGLKVLDFGLAKRRGQEVEAAAGHTGQTTRPSDLSAHEGIVGTLHYMAPEQLAGGEVDARSDIWAFGCVLYEMITGRRTFDGKTFSDVISSIMADRPIVLTLDRGLAPVALERVVQRCLARNPADRFQTATDLWRELFALLKQSPSDAGPLGAREAPVPAPVQVKTDSSVPKSSSGTRSAWDPPLVPLPEAPAEPQPAAKGGLGKVGAAVAVAATIMAAGIGGWWLLGRGPAAASVAVLPFELTAATSNTQYLSGGLAGGLSDGLARVAGLQVIPFGVASHSGGAGAEAGRTLGADRVVTGQITAKSDRIDVEARILEVESGKELWTGRFSGSASALVLLQREVIQGVVAALKLESGDAALAAIPSTMNAEAYQLVLQGRHAVALGTESSLRSAVGLFEDAIQKDPGSALAHAGLAEATRTLAAAVPAALRPGDAFSKVKQAAARALEVDASHASAHASLAVARSVYDWDWQNAGAGFNRAVELAPADPVVRELRAEWHTSLGHTKEALEDARKAVELDPRSASATLVLGSSLFAARQYADAIEQLTAALRLAPEAPAAHYTLGMAYEQSGRTDDAIQALQAAASKSGDKPVYVAGLAYVNARAGRAAEARRALTRLQAGAAREYVSPYDIALVLVGLDDRDQAIAQLERAVDEHAAGLALLAVDPRLDRIRAEPKFVELQKRVGL